MSNTKLRQGLSSALALGLVSLLGLVQSTHAAPSSQELEAAQQEELSRRAITSVGLPTINNFAEKKALKEIFELRDQNVKTFTYILDSAGKTHKICDSIGFGLPYATEYTNPQAEHKVGDHFTVLPQADPNGLFTPASADGTWVMCINPKTGKTAPLYAEPRLLISPFPLD
jgi:hypothetical protein